MTKLSSKKLDASHKRACQFLIIVCVVPILAILVGMYIQTRDAEISSYHQSLLRYHMDEIEGVRNRVRALEKQIRELHAKPT